MSEQKLLTDQKLFINRELSWLRFNTRVLQEAKKQDKPLLERLKFIAIYSTNLDEFYMIRVAGLKQLFAAGVITAGDDKMTPLNQLREIRTYIHKEKQELENTYLEIISELTKKHLFIKEYKNLSQKEQILGNDFFTSNIFPLIIPIAIDSTHPFPHLNNLSFALAVKLQDKESPEDFKFGMIRISRVLPRFVQISDNTYVPIESIVEKHIDQIFPGYELVSSAPFRVTRNADIVIEEEEADDFLEILEQGLRLRKKGAFVRIEIKKDSDPDILKFLNQHLKIFQKDIFEYQIPLNLGALWSVISNKEFNHLTAEPYNPKTLPPFDNNHDSIFSIIDKEDVVILQPFESFESVTKLIQTAAKDPKVLSIRMTLYRVEKNSPIVQALIDAANNGKQVTAIVELKARFDEENNLIWAKALEDAGAHVIYGIAGFKVHAKVTQIIKKEDDKLKFYMHLSTGNYNGSSAKIYTDISFFTSKKEIGEDVTKFFHILTGFSKQKELTNIYMSPTQIKPKIISMIENEAKAGEEGRIIAKMNALVDSDVIKALYDASKKGVKIDLVVRGVCCLRPKISGISENIRVVSIVGKYLEHARIFYFKNSTPNIFISSADWMPRNLERRLELMTPISDINLAQKLYEVLHLQINDTALAWELEASGEYKKISSAEKNINSHTMLEEYINNIYKSSKSEADKQKEILARKLFKES